MISQQVKSRCSETSGKTQCQNSASPSIAKENSKLSLTGQDLTSELICFDADTPRLSGKTNSDAFFQSIF